MICDTEEVVTVPGDFAIDPGQTLTPQQFAAAWKASSRMPTPFIELQS